MAMFSGAERRRPPPPPPPEEEEEPQLRLRDSKAIIRSMYLGKKLL